MKHSAPATAPQSASRCPPITSSPLAGSTWNWRDGRYAALPNGRTIDVVTDEEAKGILGPVITAIVATIPTPPNTPEQIDLLVRLLTGSHHEQV
jgi:hypothetical protein